MMAALHYQTVELRRTDFIGITLDGLRGPGDWARLSRDEMRIVVNVLNDQAP